MTHQDAFLQEILENPEDDTPRRIFADWLMDQGDPVSVARGEFIHIQCQLARLAPATRPKDLVRRERELLEAHSREWGSSFSRVGCTCWEYRRGFVVGVGVPAQALLSQAGTLFRSAPVDELKLYGSASLWKELANCTYLSRVRRLDLENNQLDDSDLQALAASPHLKNLDTLLLWSNEIGDSGVRALLRGALPRLSRLDLSANLVSDPGAVALAHSDFLARLRLLDLSGNQITDRGALALLDSPLVANLPWLDLGKNPISPEVQNQLRAWHASRAEEANGSAPVR